MKFEMPEGETFFVSVRNGEKKRIFETEIHKMKFLDAAREELSGSISVLGYCILDEEGDFLIIAREKEQIEDALQKAMEVYGRKLCEYAFEKESPKNWTFFIRSFQKEEFLEELLVLHYLPVRDSYTIWPEHYWWSSYQEYLGRNWRRFQIPYNIFLVRDIRKEHREWKKRHPEILRIISDMIH